ncbi:hypothetical protein [Pseudonocardia broussonetiae]|nr:hypothetical protein [Pseudonocardia broussonetiae]
MPRLTRAQLVGLGAGVMLAIGIAISTGLLLLYIVADVLAEG